MDSTTTDTATPFGVTIRDARHARRMTQTELAREIGCSKQAISAYERGRAWPPPPQLVRIADTLGISPSVLVNAIRDATPPVAA